PSGVFKPYAGVSTAILLSTKGGSTERVWFYDLQADGYSLDDKRTELKGQGSNDLPDAIAQWHKYRQMVESNLKPSRIDTISGEKTRTAVGGPAAEIAANKYGMSVSRYKEVGCEEAEYEDTKGMLPGLAGMERERMAGLDA